MKKLNSNIKVMTALILVLSILLLPMDTLALVGTESGATPDEAELSATGAPLFSGDGSQESPYLIQSSDDWDALSNYINSGGTDYTGKYFMLTDDISVSTVLGNRPDSSSDSNDNVFCGTFDGDGHKLTVNLNESDFGAAPFAFAYNTTIKNLRVDGTINSAAFHASGLVAASKGKSIYDESFLTIQNVTVSVDISCTSHIAGLIGHAHAANITMENVVFNGNLNASNIQGGMIGWGGLGNGATYSASFKDCLFAGTYNTNAAFYPIAYANGQGTTTLVNDFYTTSFGSGGSPIAPTGDGQLKLLAAQVEKDGSVQYFDNINTAADSSNWTQGSTLKLMADVSNGATITVPSGMHILDLNGHTLLELSTVGKFMVGNGASSTADLTIIDSIGTGVIKHETSRPGSLIWIKEGSSLTLDRGTLEANSSASPVIDFFQQKNASFTMNGGKITGTANNGAVRFGTNCTFTMTGGEISGLQTSTGVFDYSAGSGGAIIISGNPVVKNNTANGTTTNFNLPSGRVLTINDEMTDGASIGITTQSGPAAFTSGWKDNMGDADPSKYFTSDNDTYDVFLNKNGEAEIGVPPVASVINGDTTTNYGSLSDAVNAWTQGSTLKLLTDVTTSGTITVPSGEHTLDLNGYGILMTGNDRVVTINQGASLELNDSDPDRIHYITLTNYRGTAVSDSGEESVSNGNGVIKVTGGYLTGGYRNNSGSHDRCGAGVYNWGTFVMNGGSIVGNTLYNNSGGAIRNSGYFTMNGGTIAFNYASGNGGGVTTYVPGGSQGKMTMNGGEISDNYCGSYGGGIQIAGPIEMTGGSVVRNTAGAGGSGVFYDGKNDRFKLSGNPVIKDNSNNDDLYLGANATFMINGSLTEEADIHVLMNTPAEFTVGWKNIMGSADPSKYFTSDDSNYAVLLNSNGEAEIGVPPVASIVSGDVTTNYSTISDAVNAWTAGSTLKLLADVTTNSTITVPSGEHTLDLNGHGIRMTGSGSVFNIGSGAALDLTDSNQTIPHKFDVPDGAGLATLNETSGNYTVNGGYITGGNANQGGGVYVKGGTLILTGGTIIGNQAQREGGGVFYESNSFSMNGGAIIYNKSQTHWGGGINVGGPFNMSGGVVSHNYAGEGAGGVHCHSLVMTGGSITDNYAAGSYAGGVNVNNNATLSGNITITGNTNNAGKSNLICKSVIIADALSDTSSIGIKTQSGTGVFTSGWKDKMGEADPSKYFTSDDSNYAVLLNNNGEAEIAPPPVASIISGDVTTNYSTISDAVNAWTMGSILKLLADVTTNSTITVPSGAHTLDLNGYNLEAGSTGYSVVTVGSGAELTIDDTSENVGKITGGSVGQNYGGGVTVDGGTLTLKGGAISGNANTHGGIGNCGGGVHVRSDGKFYMEGGEISGNTSYVGGGVCTDASATMVSITGGVIKNNKTERFGSAVWAGRSTSAFFLIGGDAQLIDNISKWTGDKDGEASLNFVGELLISGNPTVHGDWKTSGTSAPNSHINLDNDGSGVQRLTLEGALTNDSGSPAITMSPIYRWNDLKSGQTFVFTKNWSQYMGTAHPADYFKLDSGVSGVTVIRKDGEATFTGSGDLGDLYITFDANGGEGEMDPQLTTVTNVTLNENTFTRKGYSFAGWNTEKDGSGTAYADKASISLSGDLVLYAQWAEPAVSIISGDVTIGYGSLSDAVSAWTAGSTLKLLEDVTTTSTITVPAGAHTLDLNGFTITRTGATGADNSGLVMTVNNGVDLTVTGPGKITGGSGFHGGGIHVEGNSSLVLDNCEISGNTGHYGGGLYLSVGTITLKNGAAVKNNTATEGFGGSGIYAEGGGTLILEDATFTENAIRNGNQHAVFLAGNANIKVSGAPVIYDNTYNGEQKNLYLYQAADQHSYVMPAGALTDGAKIGVGQTTGAGVFTVGWPTYMSDPDSAAYFISSVANYDVLMNQDGELEIAYPLVPNVSAEGFAGDYDGAAHSITVSAPEGASVKYGLQEGSFTLTENPTFTDAGTYTVYYEVSKPNYTAVTGSAEVVIRQINATVTITGYSATVDYDGEAHRSTGYQTAFSTSLYTEHDILFNGTAYAELTDVGTAMMGLKADQFTNTNDNFANVTFNVTDGYITVRPIDVTVTITGRTDIVAYDGAAHSVSGYDAAASSSLYDVTEDFTFSGTARAEQTDAGIAMMGLKSNQFTNTNSNFARVTFNVTDGSMTVNPIDVIVTITGHTDTLDYDGKAHSVSGYDASASSSLYDVTEDFTFSGTAQAELTNAGTAYMGLSSDQFKNINPNFDTVAFYITDGYVTVNPIDVTVTVTGYHNTVDYDGEAHRSTGYQTAFSSPLYQDYDILFNGTAYAELTDAGTAMMGLRPDQFTNTNSNFARVTFNVTDGYITVNPIDVTVTITGHTATLVYDGKAHSVSGYDAAASSSLYDVTGDFTFSGAAQAEQTDAGTAYMGLAPELFSNINPNFTDVAFIVTDGHQTVTRADAVITTAPYAKSKLVYTGASQQLVMPGSVTGGTLYYALGTEGSTAPAASRYSTKIPTASQIGNYYIWYKVVADTNHNSIAPAYLKITLAEPEWMTIKGTITFGDGSAASGDVTVSLMSGSTVVDTIVTDANGGYYFTVPAGVYNIVVTSGDVTQTVMVDITEGTVRDITLSDSNTKSVLDVVSSDKSIVVGGLDEEAASVRSSEGISSSRSVTVRMTVATVSAGDTTGSAAISDYAEDRYLEFYDMKVEKTVDSVTTTLSETQNVLEVAIPFSYTAKRELAVFRYDGSGVQELTESDTRAAGTYRVDYEAGLVYIYSNRFMTYAISYKPYYRVNSLLTLGSFSGSVSVKLTKDTTGDIYELNNVSMQDISFTGVPKGTYTMTVTWKDGAENTLTLPFVIK